MHYKLPFISFFAALFFVGCSMSNTPLSLLTHETTISTEEVNDAFAKVFPLQKKSSFGSIAFRRALLRPSSESDKVALSVAFGLTSFEIPEGIEGALTLSAGLRYDPATKKIYLKEVTPVGVRFNDNSLAQYVSKGAKSALNVIAMRELSDIEIYQVKKSFSARFIKNITVSKGKIVLQYGF